MNKVLPAQALDGGRRARGSAALGDGRATGNEGTGSAGCAACGAPGAACAVPAAGGACGTLGGRGPRLRVPFLHNSTPPKKEQPIAAAGLLAAPAARTARAAPAAAEVLVAPAALAMLAEAGGRRDCHGASWQVGMVDGDTYAFFSYRRLAHHRPCESMIPARDSGRATTQTPTKASRSRTPKAQCSFFPFLH